MVDLYFTAEEEVRKLLRTGHEMLFLPFIFVMQARLRLSPCSKDDPRDYRGTGVKRTMVTCIMVLFPIANNSDSMVRLTVREKTTDIDAESINVAAHHIGEVLIDMYRGR